MSDGHEVSLHTDGAGAVDALCGDLFDAVLTDLEMPHVDGHAVVREAGECQPRACLVVATARVNETVAELLKAGACFVTDKPIDYDAVTKHILECRSTGGPRADGRCHMRLRPAGQRLLPCRRE
jgi:two-component system, NarL family, capsular synthesis sensor histidine kinase RcsC